MRRSARIVILDYHRILTGGVRNSGYADVRQGILKPAPGAKADWYVHLVSETGFELGFLQLNHKELIAERNVA